jgi:hypothetical protein
MIVGSIISQFNKIALFTRHPAKLIICRVRAFIIWSNVDVVWTTHPVCAPLDDPLFAFGGKRVGEIFILPLFPAKPKRG